MSQHTIPIIQVRSILRGAEYQGYDVALLLQRAGIPSSLLESPRSRVSQYQYAQLIRLLRRELRDELWGLCWRPLPPGSFGQALRLMVACDTLEEALRTSFQFYHLMLNDFVARLHYSGHDAELRLVGRTQSNERQQYAQRTFLFFTFGIASWLVERRLPINAVTVRESEPMEPTETSRIFQAPVLYDQPYTGFRFDSAWLHNPVRQDNVSLREFLTQAPANLLTKYRDHSRLTERIRRYLRRRLRERVPVLEEVAEELNMTPQTLRRRLRDEGEGYQIIKDEVRRDAAVHLLARPGLSPMEIANRTGFSEPSTFHRAFKKWTGLAPNEYRQTVLEASAAVKGGRVRSSKGRP